MPQQAIWSRATIRELLALAEAEGCARATLESPQDAERFRYAIYDFRRKNATGYDLTVTLDANVVVVTKIETPSVTIQHGATP